MLANFAAESRRASLSVRRLLGSGKVAVKHSAALLGAVTHAANNHKVLVQSLDGSWVSQTVRDPQQPLVKRAVKRLREPKPPPQPAPQPAVTAADLSLVDTHPKRLRTVRA